MFSSWQKGRELVGPLLLSAALLPALYFNGIHIECFALYEGLLFAVLGLLAWQWFKSGISIPNTSIALWLSLFWLWLGVSLLWHPIPMVGLNYFWIVGTFPFAFWLYTLAIPYFLIPLSFAWAPFIPWLRALAAPSGSLGENLKRYALAWVCAALIALSFLLLATLNYAQLHTSSAISSCGGSGELVAEMKADGNGTLFVFPSRSGYYAILGKKPLFPLIYHHTVSDVPQTDAWLEERVLAPVEAAMPDHILYFNGSNDRRSFGERSLGEWEAFLGKNYRAEYFNVSGDEAIYYSKIAGRTQ